ncbi:MAG TPA: hypothetical protein PKW35_16100 [Nannocystaceae bacterium]|nr:hypothetical protein [Nannocystaceae bacterium]
MGDYAALVAFALLWLGLAVFFFLVIRTLVVRRRHGEDDRWEHGL